MGRESKKATINYDKRLDGKIVYKRKIGNPEKQAKAPKQKGKPFTLPTANFKVCRMKVKKDKPDTE